MSDAPGVVLDAGAFIALERRNAVIASLVQRFAEERTPLVTSAAVVAQVWRGEARQVPTTFLLRRTEVVDLTGPVARLLGRMLASTGSKDVVDAHVVFLARTRGWSVLTSDPDDLLAIDPKLELEHI